MLTALRLLFYCLLSYLSLVSLLTRGSVGVFQSVGEACEILGQVRCEKPASFALEAVPTPPLSSEKALRIQERDLLIEAPSDLVKFVARTGSCAGEGEAGHGQVGRLGPEKVGPEDKPG